MINEFKLIAITPLTGCSSTFSKKLTIGQPHKFYKEYDITLDEQKSKVLTVSSQDDAAAPKSLYKLQNGIVVNFSAVIGINGSGKSTLFELLYQVIYFLGTRHPYFNKTILTTPTVDLNVDLNTTKSDLEEVKAFIHTIKSSNTFSSEMPDKKISRDGITLDILALILKHKLEIEPLSLDSTLDFLTRVKGRLTSKIADIKAGIREEEIWEELVSSNFNVSIIYKLGEYIREIHCYNGTVNLRQVLPNNQLEAFDKPFDLDDFFYTISLNYSHHGLNALTTGKWINKLFHKNDAYRTPVVINPMRENGNFNINHELRLSGERLMATLVFDLLQSNNTRLLDKYKVKSFIFSLKSIKQDQVGIQQEFDKLTHAEILTKKFQLNSGYAELPYGTEAINYLDSKIEKISENYDFLLSSDENTDLTLEHFVDTDPSHIRKKIRQVLKYLKAPAMEVLKKIWEKANGDAIIELSPEELLEYINAFGDKIKTLAPYDLIEYALPGFFNIDFEFQNEDESKIKFSEMSSGEQQMIFNINAVMYHLYNLQSVPRNFDSTKSNNIKRPSYKNVNIVLDEMELYYHPEMQRMLVKTMLDSFEHLNKQGGIKHINVCILTHSPFILSDIPSQNILHLGDHPSGSNLDQPTFAANIHDLLRNEFSMESGFMGEFAREKLNKVVDSLVVHRAIQEKLKVKKLNKSQIVALSVDYRKEYSEEILTKKECEESIKITAEPVLYQSLMSLLLQAFPQEEDNIIDAQMKYLDNLKNKTAKR